MSTLIEETNFVLQVNSNDEKPLFNLLKLPTENKKQQRDEM